MKNEKTEAMNDALLDRVAGGTQDSETREADGICPICEKNTRWHITTVKYSDNGPWKYSYYYCDRCGQID